MEKAGWVSSFDAVVFLMPILSMFYSAPFSFHRHSCIDTLTWANAYWYSLINIHKYLYDYCRFLEKFMIERLYNREFAKIRR